MSAVAVVARMIFDDECTLGARPHETPTIQYLDATWQAMLPLDRKHYLDRARRYIDAADADRGMGPVDLRWLP